MLELSGLISQRTADRNRCLLCARAAQAQQRAVSNRLSIRLAGVTAFVSTSAFCLMRVVDNLLQNAAKCPPRGVSTLSCRNVRVGAPPANRRRRLLFGIGIEPEKREWVFGTPRKSAPSNPARASGFTPLPPDRHPRLRDIRVCPEYRELLRRIELPY